MFRRGLFLQLILFSFLAVTATAQADSPAAVAAREADERRRIEVEIAAYRETLQEWPCEEGSKDWAATQNSLGNALATLGSRESGTARQEEAVSAFREVLHEWTRARVPLQWAKSTGNQGVAFMLLAERRGDAEMARLAVQQIEAAFSAARDGGDAPSAAESEAQLPKARALAQKLAKR